MQVGLVHQFKDVITGYIMGAKQQVTSMVVVRCEASGCKFVIHDIKQQQQQTAMPGVTDTQPPNERHQTDDQAVHGLNLRCSKRACLTVKSSNPLLCPEVLCIMSYVSSNPDQVLHADKLAKQLHRLPHDGKVHVAARLVACPMMQPSLLQFVVPNAASSYTSSVSINAAAQLLPWVTLEGDGRSVQNPVRPSHLPVRSTEHQLSTASTQRDTQGKQALPLQCSNLRHAHPTPMTDVSHQISGGVINSNFQQLSARKRLTSGQYRLQAHVTGAPQIHHLSAVRSKQQHDPLLMLSNKMTHAGSQMSCGRAQQGSSNNDARWTTARQAAGYAVPVAMASRVLACGQQHNIPQHSSMKAIRSKKQHDPLLAARAPVQKVHSQGCSDGQQETMAGDETAAAPQAVQADQSSTWPPNDVAEAAGVPPLNNNKRIPGKQSVCLLRQDAACLATKHDSSIICPADTMLCDPCSSTTNDKHAIHTDLRKTADILTSKIPRNTGTSSSSANTRPGMHYQHVPLSMAYTTKLAAVRAGNTVHVWAAQNSSLPSTLLEFTQQCGSQQCSSMQAALDSISQHQQSCGYIGMFEIDSAGQLELLTYKLRQATAAHEVLLPVAAATALKEGFLSSADMSLQCIDYMLLKQQLVSWQPDVSIAK